MVSNEVEIDQSKSELKHLGFLQEIAVKLLVLLLDLYDFAKENSGVFKKKVVYAENAFVSAMSPVYGKLENFSRRVIVFVDEKFDKYAPSFAKNLVVKFKSLIDKTTPSVQKLLTTAQSVVTPLIATTISLLQKLFKSIIQKFITIIKFGKSQTLFQKGPKLANIALDTTKSIISGIPLIGNVAQSVITNPTNLANQLVKENLVLEAVKLVAQNTVKEAQSAGMKVALQSAYVSFKLVAIPVIAQWWYKVNKYPLVNALAQLVIPVVEYLCELYNEVVTYMDGRGYSLFGYLPLVPIDEMKAAYKLVKTTMDGLSAVGDLASGLLRK